MIITTVSKTFNHRDIVVQKLGLNQKIYLCVCRTSIAQCYSDWLLKGSLPMRSQLFCERPSFDKVWVLNFSCISCQKQTRLCQPQTIVKWIHPTPCWHLWIVRVENENKPSKGTYFLQMSPTSPFHTSHIEPSPNSPVMWFHFSFELTMPVSNWSKPGVGFFSPPNAGGAVRSHLTLGPQVATGAGVSILSHRPTLELAPRRCLLTCIGNFPGILWHAGCRLVLVGFQAILATKIRMSGRRNIFS